MKKPVIIAIVGPSGSGKTVMAEYLERELGIPTIVSYTTRPMRENEVDGVGHYFVTIDAMPHVYEMLAYTEFGGYYYWANKSQVSEVCSYIIDELGLMRLYSKFHNNYDIVPIQIVRDQDILTQTIDSERLQRDQDRVALEDLTYRVVIKNNGTLDEFYKTISRTIKSIL